MSYVEFYALKEHPFSTAVDNRFYYNSTQHAEALVRLKYAAEGEKGLAVLVGDIGTGKTTLAQRMLDELDEGQYESALLIIIHTSVTSEWLLRRIAVQIGVENPAADKTELLAQLYKKLTEIHEGGKTAVVLIDEAQMLKEREIMEEFRGMLNIEMDGHKLITFILFGLPDLDQRLALDGPLKQRVALRYELKSFTDGITADYIRYRLGVAGSTKDLFTKEALKSIHLHSGGVPRIINTICDNALLEGFLRKKNQVDHLLIEEVVKDLKLAPLASAQT